MAWTRLVSPATTESLGYVHWYDPEKAAGWLRRAIEIASPQTEAAIDGIQDTPERKFLRQKAATIDLAQAIDSVYVSLNLRRTTDPYYLAFSGERFGCRIHCGVPPGMTAEQYQRITRMGLPLPNLGLGPMLNRNRPGGESQGPVPTAGDISTNGRMTWAFLSGGYARDQSVIDIPGVDLREPKFEPPGAITWNTSLQLMADIHSDPPSRGWQAIGSGPRNQYKRMQGFVRHVFQDHARTPEQMVRDAYNWSALARTNILALSGAEGTSGLVEQVLVNETALTAAAGAQGFRAVGGVITAIGAAVTAAGAGNPIVLAVGLLITLVGQIASVLRAAVGSCYDENCWVTNWPKFTTPAVDPATNSPPTIPVLVPPAPGAPLPGAGISPVVLGGGGGRPGSGSGPLIVSRSAIESATSRVSATVQRWYRLPAVKLGGVAVIAMVAGAVVATMLGKPKKKKKKR